VGRRRSALHRHGPPFLRRRGEPEPFQRDRGQEERQERGGDVWAGEEQGPAGEGKFYRSEQL